MIVPGTQDSTGEPGDNYASLVFDLDYADGLARPDVTLTLYQQTAAGPVLVAASFGSNVGDDQSPPLSGSGLQDLDAGSLGSTDPLLGPIMLPEGTYVIAVSTNALVPTAFDVSEAAANPLVRIEPLDSISRVGEDHVGGGSTVYANPSTPTLLATGDEINPNDPHDIVFNSLVPWHLGDVSLYATIDTGPDMQRLLSVNPFTGTTVNTIGDFEFDVADLAFRENSELYAFTLGIDDPLGPTDDNSGALVQLDHHTGVATLIDDDGIETYEIDDMGDEPEVIRSNDDNGWGIQFEAMTFIGRPADDTNPDDDWIMAIGYRGDADMMPNGVTSVENLVYWIDPITGIAQPLLEEPTVDEFTADGTNVQTFLGEINTAFSAGGGDTALLVTEATELVGGVTTRLIPDGLTFGIGGVTFEMDAGPEAVVDFDLTAGEFIADGEFFLLNGTRFEFDGGPVLEVVGAGADFTDGDTITVVNDDTPSQTMTFEFDSGGGVLPGSRRIPFDTGFTLAQMNQGIVSAINAAAFGVTAELSNGHIVLTGDSGLVLSGAFAGALNRVGDYGVTSGNAVVVEENDTPGAVRNAIADAVNATGTLTAGVDGERLNFPDATTADFAGTQFIDALAGAAGGVAGANVEIDFLADDTGAEIATKIAAAVDNAVGAGTTNVGGRTVRLTGATVDAADAPFMAGGSAPGGRITGVTQLADGRVFAVSDEGGLYQINGDNESGVTGAYVDSAIELLGIRFTGLDAGPANVEDEAYAGMLFGIDRAGDLWAFDTAGFLQPVFMGGETSISTGLAGVEGIAFSTLDRNLWYETIPGDDTLEREEDLGHGVDVPFTGSREQAVGDGSLHFGLGEGMTYDFPGGARGTIISNSFSLEGYSPSDQPYLYFNYFLTGQDTEAGDDPEIFDSFRVYVSDDSVEGERGVWHLVATNNDVIVDTTDDFIPNDEYDDPNPLDSIDFPVQTLYDGAGWRQARIPLEQFAGRSGVRIRFDYSTAGSMNVGDVDGTAAGPLTGEELRAADGAVLRDGDVFSIDDILFEFDLGYTLILPTGDKVIDGETITVDGTTFEFDSDGNTSGGIPIPFLSNQTASLVAANVQRALMDNGVGGAELPINGNRLQLLEVLDLIQGQAIGATGLSIGLEGEPGAAFGTGVPINSAMSSVEVAQAMVQPIADELANGSTVAIKTFQDYVRVIGNSITDFVHPVTNEFTSGQGPLGRALVNPDPLNPIYLNGDQYGNYVNVFPDEAPPPALQQNLNEGVYIDDVIIGFAERGELVLNATVSDTLFIENPAREDTDIEVGGYQLEIRRATKYGEPTGLDEPPLALTRSFDTNARLDAAATIFAPSGADISESQTFIISDGVDVVTFEFDEIFFDDAGAPVLGDGVANGNVPVLFLPSMKDHEVASSLITAINGRAAQATLDVSAAFGDGTFIGLAATTSNQVNLFGDSVVLTTNPVFSPESNDQIDEAIGTGIVEDSIGTYWFGGYIGDNIELLEQPGGMTSDVDLYAVTLAAGQRLVVDIQTPQRGTTSLKTLESFVRVFDEAGVAVTFFDRLLGADANLESNDNDVFNRLPELWNPLEPDNIDTLSDYVLGSGYADPYLRFIAPADGTYYIGVSGAGNSAYDPNDASTAEPGGSAGAYFMRLDVGGGTIAPDSEALPSISINTLPAMGSGTIPYITYDYEGDDNRFRDQGQLIIQSNRIADSEEYAIRLEVAPRTADGLPKPGSTRVLRELNEGGLATSAVVMNNLLVGNLQGGVHISGYPDDDPTLPANPLAPIPFARVVNNTIYGVSDNDVGILVENNASPTLLNNILANLGQPIDLDFTSRSTIIGGSLYHRNDNGPTRAGDFAVTLANSATLFVDVANRNFIPVDGSAAIDSSIDSLDERAIQTTIKDPMGLARSPILAPEFDIDGQVRVDDPSVPSPPGLGQNVFKDRGAIDRVDFEGPIAVLLEPADNDAVGVDRNPAESIVDVALNLNLFQIQLVDLAEFGEGIGIDNNTVTSSSVTVTRDGQLLEQGVGYSYVYDSTNHVIRLRPVAGIWGGGTYVVSLDSDISDLAGNLLRPNQTNGDVTFTIIIDDSVALDYGDAPDPSYPTLLASDGASHIISPGLFLGNGVTADPDGKPSATGTADDGDDGVTFDSALVIGSSVPITVTASAAGQLDAWVDFNGDGDWLDVGERVFTSRALLAGDNVLNINIPATAADGDTFARFRFSSAGGLSPTGSADDGEVEDYRVNITQNPWHNFTDATDVINNDGTTLIDILRIITELDTHAFSDPASGRLPVPPPISSPPLLDVNNDGFVSPVDVILAIGVVDELIAQSQAVANIQPVSLPQAPLGEMIAADLSGIGSDDATVLVSPPPFSVANYVRNLPRDTSARDATFADGNADNQGVVRLSTASYTEEDGQAESSIQRRVARRATYRRDVSTELAVQTVRSTNEEETVDDLFAQW
ncbi:MAG: pre-peptidase C-terminal domain-containing protein [Planctomycetales bacterium]|nr:pre-peptidase C-terminal domain-containing protein [Planctomycetales bacterium]